MNDALSIAVNAITDARRVTPRRSTSSAVVWSVNRMADKTVTLNYGTAETGRRFRVTIATVVV